ncbi:MAG: deoxyribose-phosphate aldolase [Candidatus Aminicenantes bacterium]|jgi:deoxyribose-phosphate aldolase
MNIQNLRLSSLAKMIDHSLLHPTFTEIDMSVGCDIAQKYKVATVCVKPYSVETVRKILDVRAVGICAVVAFPHGNSCTDIKIEEAVRAVSEGASEIDMVVNVGKILGGDWEYVSDEIERINEAVVSRAAILKVIFENDFLQDEHIIQLCRICGKHRVAFVKTSTGYGFVKQENGFYSYKGATEHQVKLMRKHCPEDVQVKAAGGIRSLDGLLRMRKLGVTRIGATATATILEEAIDRGCIKDL